MSDTFLLCHIGIYSTFAAIFNTDTIIDMVIKTLIPMKRLNILLVLCVGAFACLSAQTDSTATVKAWKFDGNIGLNATGTGLVNWTGGGKNSVNGLTFVRLHLLYDKDAIAWESDFDTDFGVSWIDQTEDRLRKASDKINFSTKFGWEFRKDLYLTVLGSFQSQYIIGREIKKGYDPPISKFLAPSYTDMGIGIDWKHTVSGCDFSVFVSPVAGRITTAYVSDKLNGYYTAEHREMVPDEKDYDFRRYLQEKYGTYKIILNVEGVPDIQYNDARAEFGFFFKGTIAYKYDNMTLGSTLMLYTPYQGRGYDIKTAYEATHPGEIWDVYYRYSNLNRQFGYFDVDWDTNLSYRFAKVLNVTLSTSLKYYPGVLIADNDGVKKERVQFKAVVGIGLGYSF